jgi:hypothetical protein
MKITENGIRIQTMQENFEPPPPINSNREPVPKPIIFKYESNEQEFY